MLKVIFFPPDYKKTTRKKTIDTYLRFSYFGHAMIYWIKAEIFHQKNFFFVLIVCCLCITYSVVATIVLINLHRGLKLVKKVLKNKLFFEKYFYILFRQVSWLLHLNKYQKILILDQWWFPLNDSFFHIIITNVRYFLYSFSYHKLQQKGWLTIFFLRAKDERERGGILTKFSYKNNI